jgi:hypothetical protein
MSKQPKKYSTDSFEQFFNVVSEENYVRFMSDFSEHVGIYLQICKRIRRSDPKKENLRNSELAKMRSFNWTDDGKIGANELILIDSDTGELKSIKKISKRKNTQT